MNNMLHMKLLMTSTALLMAFPFDISAQELELKSAFSNSETFKLARACFLPDCGEDIGDINMNINNDTRWCEKKGYTYYSSGKCPEYYLLDGTCKKDSNYLKCDGDKWCKNNGYSKTTCASTQTLDTVCPNNLPYYKNCKCKPEFRYNSSNCSGNNKPEGTSCASSGTGTGLDTKTYYNQCNCYPTPPNASYSYTCTGSEVQADGCGRYYHRCCSDTCSRGSKSYSGSYATTTECGSRCYYCKDCTSGSTSYNGSYVGWSECGSCYSCSDTCSRGTRGSASCSGSYRSVMVGSTQCGSGCYECQYNSDCDVTSKSCSYGCASSNSCGRCTSCKSNPDCNATSKSCRYACTSTNSCGKCTACQKCPSTIRRNPAQPDDAGWMTSGCFALTYKPAYNVSTVSDSGCYGTGWHVPSESELAEFGYFHKEYSWLSDGGCPSGQHKAQWTNYDTNEKRTLCINPNDSNYSVHLRCVKQFTPDY